MAIKVQGTEVISDSKYGQFQIVNPGAYTTANRPSTPNEGDVIFDTDLNQLVFWNGTEWAAGGSGGGEPQIITAPTLTAASEYPEALLTATEATFVNATRTPDSAYSPWFKDDVQITGATGLTYNATSPGVYKYQERWVGDDGTEIFPSVQLTIKNPTIAKPEVLAPKDGIGIGGDITYFPESSAIAADGVNVIQVQSVFDTSIANYSYTNGNTEATGANLLGRVGTTLGVVGTTTGKSIKVPFKTNYGGVYAGLGLVTDNTNFSTGTYLGDPQSAESAGALISSTGSVTFYSTTSVDSDAGIVTAANGADTLFEIQYDFDNQKILLYRDGTFVKDYGFAPANGATVKAGIGSNGGTVSYYIQLSETTTLTLTNDKAFNEADGTEVSTIDQVFTEGTLVKGKGGAPATSKTFGQISYQGTASTNPQQTFVDNSRKAMIWIKNTDNNANHYIVDTERGPSYDGAPDIAQLASNTRNKGESLGGGVNDLSGSTIGFQVTGGSPLNNESGKFYMAYNFRAAPKFMDVVTFDGDGVDGRKVPHGLETDVGMILLKCTSNDDTPWTVWHCSLQDQESFLTLNSNSPALSQNSPWGDPFSITNEHFSVNNYSWTNQVGKKYVAYVFAKETANLIKCGYYITDGQAGKQIELGFEPQWILTKDSSGNNGNYAWVMSDETRGWSTNFEPDSQQGNETNSGMITTNSTGYAVGGYGKVNDFASNRQIYMAIAKNAIATEFPPEGRLNATADPANLSMDLADVKGAWAAGMTVVGQTQLTDSAPDPTTLEFVGSIPGSSNGTIETWGDATWSVKNTTTDAIQTETKAITPGVTQTLDVGNQITLSGGTEYEVTVTYDSPDAASSATSDPNTFKTNYPYKWQTNTNWPADYGINQLYSTSAVARQRVGETSDFRTFIAAILSNISSGDEKRLLYQNPGENTWQGILLPNQVSGDVLRVMEIHDDRQQLIIYPKGDWVLTVGTNSTDVASANIYSLNSAGPSGQESYAAEYCSSSNKMHVMFLNGNINYSSDGISNWSADQSLYNFLTSKSCRDLKFYHQYSKWFACGDNSGTQGGLWVGDFGGDTINNWRSVDANYDITAYNWRAIAVPSDTSTDKVVAVGEQGITYSESSDGTNWKLASGFDAGSRFQDVSYNTDGNTSVWVAVNTATTGRPIAVSTDGVTWQSQDLPGGATQMYSVLGYQNKFSVVGSLSDTGNQIYDVAAGNIVIQNQTLYYDTNKMEGVTGQELLDRYGSLDNLAELGIAELIEQPDYANDGYFVPAGYELQPDGIYKFIRDYASELAAVREAFETYQAENPES